MRVDELWQLAKAGREGGGLPARVVMKTDNTFPQIIYVKPNPNSP